MADERIAALLAQLPPDIRPSEPPEFLQNMWNYLGVLPGQGRSFFSAPPQSPNQRVQDAFKALGGQ